MQTTGAYFPLWYWNESKSIPSLFLSLFLSGAIVSVDQTPELSNITHRFMATSTTTASKDANVVQVDVFGCDTQVDLGCWNERSLKSPDQPC